MIDREHPSLIPFLILLYPNMEVLSDSTRSRDLVKKLDLYMESGIKEYWVVNTSSAEIYIYVFINNIIEKILSFKGDDIAESTVFPGLGVALKQVFTIRRD